MQLHRNFSFNQKNITYKTSKDKNKTNINNIIRLKNNFNIGKNKNNKINLNDSNDDDISFYNYITTLKNQIFSPENGEDIYLYNYNKKMEKKIKYEDEKNSNYNLLPSKSVKNMNNKTNIKNNLNNNINNTNNKKTLILDLDETLVHSLFEPEKTNNNIIKPDIYLKIFFNNKFQEIFVYKRPYLDIFLKEMRKIYDIYVFTASIEKYAKPLLDKLDKDNLIIKKFYRESCLLSEGKFIKDLNSLNLNIKLKDIIIIDNNPFSYKFNKNNGIPIKSWHFDKADTELIKIIPLLKYLAKTEDVRKYIPYIVKNDEINFEQINSIINSNNKNRKILNENEKESKIIPKKQKSICQIINYNNFNNDKNLIKKNYVQTYHNPETINFREPQKNSQQKKQMKNFNNKINININNNSNNNVIYRNNININKFKRNGSIAINFNSDEINNNINNIKSQNLDKFFKSYNNFYINNKYSLVINQEKENDKSLETNDNNKIIHNKIININLEQQKSFEDYQNIVNFSNIYKMHQSKKKKKIPTGKKDKNKIDNKTSRIFMEYKTCNSNVINNNKDLIRRCSSYKHFNEKEKNDINKIKPLIKTNNNYIILKKSNTLRPALDNVTNNINNKNNPSLNNIPKSKYQDKKKKKDILFQKGNEIYNKNFCNNKEKECKGKNNFPKGKIKYKNILFRNKVQSQKLRSFSFSNFNKENFS